MSTGELDNLSIFKVTLCIELYNAPVELDGIEYDGTVKIIRMWTHYEGVL